MHQLQIPMNTKHIFNLVFSITLLSHLTFCAEFTFDLPDNEEQCFYEVIQKNIPCKLEFQVSYLLYYTYAT